MTWTSYYRITCLGVNEFNFVDKRGTKSGKCEISTQNRADYVKFVIYKLQILDSSK